MPPVEDVPASASIAAAATETSQSSSPSTANTNSSSSSSSSSEFRPLSEVLRQDDGEINATSEAASTLDGEESTTRRFECIRCVLSPPIQTKAYEHLRRCKAGKLLGFDILMQMKPALPPSLPVETRTGAQHSAEFLLLEPVPLTSSQERACRTLADHINQCTDLEEMKSDEYITLPWFELLEDETPTRAATELSPAPPAESSEHQDQAAESGPLDNEGRKKLSRPWWWTKFVINEALWVELTRGQVMPTPAQGWYGCEPTTLPEPTGVASRRPPRRSNQKSTTSASPSSSSPSSSALSSSSFSATASSTSSTTSKSDMMDANAPTNAESEEAAEPAPQILLELTPQGDTPLAIAAAAQRQRYRELLNGRAFLTKYNTRRLYTVHDLDFSRDSHRHGFLVGITRTTFAKYFENRYDYTLSRALQPILLHGTSAMPAHCSTFAVADVYGTPDPHSTRVALFPELCQLLNVFSELLLYWRLLPTIIEHLSIHVDVLSCMEFLGYRFRSPRWLRQALIHPSCAAQFGMKHEIFQQLEVIGDGVLDLCMMTRLYTQFPLATDTALAYLNRGTQSNTFFTRLLCESGLEKFTRIQPGISHKRYADTFEAIFGAIFMDHKSPRDGFATCERIFAHFLFPHSNLLRWQFLCSGELLRPRTAEELNATAEEVDRLVLAGQNRLEAHFRHPTLLVQALTHFSVLPEKIGTEWWQRGRNWKRLGDDEQPASDDSDKPAAAVESTSSSVLEGKRSEEPLASSDDSVSRASSSQESKAKEKDDSHSNAEDRNKDQTGDDNNEDNDRGQQPVMFQTDEPVSDNSRLRVLGRAVTRLSLAYHFCKRYPLINAGELSVARNRMLRADQLSHHMDRLGLTELLRFDPAEVYKEGYRQKVCAAAFMAAIGALYRDRGCNYAGFEECSSLLKHLLFDQVCTDPEKVLISGLPLLVVLCKSLKHPIPVVRFKEEDDGKVTTLVFVGKELISRATHTEECISKERAVSSAIERYMDLDRLVVTIQPDSHGKLATSFPFKRFWQIKN